MTQRNACRQVLLFVTAFAGLLIVARSGFAQPAEPAANARMDPDKARIIDYWSNGRRAAATPRDLVIDPRGLGYLRRADGSLQPHGHAIAAQSGAAAAPSPAGSPNAGPGSDTTPPSVSGMDPAQGAVIGSTYTFSAVVTDDASGVRSVAFVVRYPDGATTQTFQPVATGNDTWTATLQGFSDGNWSWRVEARDGAKRGGNRTITNYVDFVVDTGGSGSGSSGGSGGSSATGIVTSAEWDTGGAVLTAAGRLYFEMPNNTKRKGPWTGYVCSGTVVTDGVSGRSIILTAAHCVYDDANKAFARNVLFIPDQAGTSGSGTDLNCNNDPLGCWVPSFGVVDVDWTTRTFPDNIAWDYAYYVVDDNGAHAGASATSDSLETAAGALPISFDMPYSDDGVPGASSIDFTHALGYSYNDDPKFMFCAEDMTTEGAVNWWLPSCELSGGSSGGPWVQPMDTATGSGPVMSVNSWGYTTAPGMAGPKLVSSSAQCVFTMAKSVDWSEVGTRDGDAGWAQNCP
jgi:hypothetical protein